MLPPKEWPLCRPSLEVDCRRECRMQLISVSDPGVDLAFLAAFRELRDIFVHILLDTNIFA